MYKRAKNEGVKFYQFYEWIEHDIRETLYILDKQPEFKHEENFSISLKGKKIIKIVTQDF